MYMYTFSFSSIIEDSSSVRPCMSFLKSMMGPLKEGEKRRTLRFTNYKTWSVGARVRAVYGPMRARKTDFGVLTIQIDNRYT